MRILLSFALFAVVSLHSWSQCTATFAMVNNDPTISFTNTTAGNVDYTYWDFGDGDTTNGLSVSHTYTANGAYEVCMSSIDSVTMTGCTTCDSVFVTNTSATGCSVSFNMYYSLLTNIHSFASLPVGTPPFTYSWTFGDGGTSTLANPDHFYGNYIDHNVCLNITDSLGCTASYCDVAGFPALGGSGCQAGTAVSIAYAVDSNNTVTLAATSTGPGPYTYYWGLGDSTFSTAANPVHTYANGTYYPCAIVTDANGCATVMCDTMTVYYGTVATCSAYFYAFDDSTQTNTIQIYNMSSGISPVSYVWDFGDGDTSNQAFPTHTYAQLGTYQVCVSILDGGLSACTSSYCDSVSMTARMNGFTINVISPFGSTSGIDDMVIPELALYPNPASRSVTVKWTNAEGKTRITLRDASGRVVQEQAFVQTAETMLDLSDVAAGYYTVQVSSNTFSKSIPLIVE